MALTKRQQRAVEHIYNNARRSNFAVGKVFNGQRGAVDETLNAKWREALNADIARRFNDWFDTWIEPQLRIIEGKGASDGAASRRV